MGGREGACRSRGPRRLEVLLERAVFPCSDGRKSDRSERET